jgi:hypothetical protein
MSKYITKILVLPLLLALGAANLQACKPSLPNRTETALLANSILEQLLVVYETQQKLCVTKYTGQVDAQKLCITKVRANWEPVWVAFDSLQAAEDLKVEWCKFLDVLSRNNIAIPALKDLQAAC